MRLRYTAEARVHIEAIHDYIHERSPAAAKRVVTRIKAIAERLAEFPYTGHVGIVPGAREWVVRGLPYVIVHQVDPVAHEVVIMAVFHGAQNRGQD
jgi:plasmid stabilization system protein ParE